MDNYPNIMSKIIPKPINKKFSITITNEEDQIDGLMSPIEPSLIETLKVPDSSPDPHKKNQNQNIKSKVLSHQIENWLQTSDQVLKFPNKNCRNNIQKFRGEEKKDDNQNHIKKRTCFQRCFLL